MPLGQYLLLVAYPAISLSLVRSFCEHQAAADLGERTVIVEAAPVWSLLFLNNNLHVAHHTRPSLAWYRLPAYYRAERAALIASEPRLRDPGLRRDLPALSGPTEGAGRLPAADVAGARSEGRCCAGVRPG